MTNRTLYYAQSTSTGERCVALVNDNKIELIHWLAAEEYAAAENLADWEFPMSAYDAARDAADDYEWEDHSSVSRPWKILSELAVPAQAAVTPPTCGRAVNAPAGTTIDAKTYRRHAMNDTIVVNGREYRAVTTSEERLRIIIADNRGLTFIGHCSLPSEDDGEWVLIRGARCIIKWGTQEHLAELCEGPLEETVLGAKRDVRVRRANIVAIYECDQEGWRK